MAFDEIRLPVEIEYGASGGAKFRTTVFQSKAGNEQRVAAWANRLGEWKVGFGLQDDDLRNDLITFFHARRGKFRGFRFRDWSDYKHDMAAGAPKMAFGTGDGTVGPFQILKTYDDGVQTYAREIAKLVAPIQISTFTLTTYVLNESIDYTIDLNTGLVTFLNTFQEDDVTVSIHGSPTEITTSGAHGRATGDSVYMEGGTGAQSSVLNQFRKNIIVTGANTFTVPLDTTGGSITGLDIHAAPSSEETLRWTGEFDIPVRLDEDLMEVELEFHKLSNWRGIKIVETREIS